MKKFAFFFMALVVVLASCKPRTLNYDPATGEPIEVDTSAAPKPESQPVPLDKVADEGLKAAPKDYDMVDGQLVPKPGTQAAQPAPPAQPTDAATAAKKGERPSVSPDGLTLEQIHQPLWGIQVAWFSSK